MVDILKLRKMSETSKSEIDGGVNTETEVKSEIEIPQKIQAPEKSSVQEPKETAPTITIKEEPKKTQKKAASPAPVINKTPAPEPEAPPVVTSPAASSDREQNVIDLVVFTLAERLFGVDIIKVQEVVRYTEITRVPNAAEFVLGVMNLRGNITPVIDLHKRFSLTEASWTDKTRIIVLQIKDQAIGFLVDHVSEIMHPLESDIEPTSTVHANIGTDYISGVVKIRDSDENAKKLLILLNLEKIFDEGSIALS